MHLGLRVRSSDGDAAVDNYRLSGDVTARLGCKPHHRTRQLFWFAGSSEEHASFQLFDVASGYFQLMASVKKPGAIALTRIPFRLPHCCARSRVTPAMAALLAL